MRKALFGGILAAALIGSSPAQAGCWATVSLSPPPVGTTAGQTWNAELTVLQHGQTPLAGASPRVTVVNVESGARRSFAANPASGRSGRYDAEVVFPTGGSWRYEVFDGFTHQGDEAVPCARTHTFATVEIAGPSAGASSRWLPVWPLLAVPAALLTLAAAVALAVRRKAARHPAAA